MVVEVELERACPQACASPRAKPPCCRHRWRLSEGEVMELDRVSAGMPEVPGAPIEQL